jgi:O-antigen/teichoic acid export membrane protein
VLARGLDFFIIDATLLSLLRAPELIVARLHGVEAVAPFAAVARVSAVIVAVLQVIFMPLWPAIGDAAARGDLAWIKRAARRSLAGLLALWAAGSLVMLLLGPLFIERWTGLRELVDRNLIAAAVAQMLGQGLVAWLAVFLGGLSLQRPQVIATGVAALVFFPLAIACGRLWGPLGVAVAQAAALLLVAVPIGARVVARTFRQPDCASKDDQ